MEGWTDDEAFKVEPGEGGLVVFGGHTRRAKFVDFTFVPGPNVRLLRPKPTMMARFLFHYLDQCPVEEKGYADHFPEVRRAEIPLPPLEEQRRIVAVLDRAASIRRRADTARQQARALIPALFLDLFGDPATNPKGWPRDKFEDVAEDVTRHVPKIMRREYQPTGRFPIYDQGQTEIAGYTDEPSQTTEIGSELLLFGDHTRVFRLVRGRFARGADGVRVFCFKKRLKPMFGRTFLELHGLPDAGYSRHYKFLKEVEMMVPPLPLQTAFAEQAARIESLAQRLDAAAAKAESLAASLSAAVFGDAGVAHSVTTPAEVEEVAQ